MTKPTTRDDLTEKIRQACRSISREEIRNAVRSIRRRAQMCLDQGGRQFEHLM